ncbi:MAG: M14 family metallopeptidase, partial [Raineya sp.]|nr:M14 family metallopeptidase [Raineya sp.]
MQKNILSFILAFNFVFVFAQKQEDLGLRALGTPPNPKVKVAWNRYYTYDEVTNICRQIQKAYPDLVSMESIGKSYQGKDIWALTITDFKTGKPETKPAFYIDGNIHSNEVQGTEVALYTAWYLTENYKDVKFIRELLQEKTFYILPTINPDGRDDFLKNLNNANTPRSGLIPIDDDGDGLIDEDDFDDLNGDGEITLMRRKSKTGRYIPHPSDPRQMIMAKPGEPGEYELLGYEGLDNDGDGLVNEDRKGYYDPNRDWGWNWQPDYIQFGANKYPFSLPESRAVADFVMKHPNIAGSQHYH